MSSSNIAIIFAGGSGKRMGAGRPKQFLEVNGKPIIIHTIENFQYHDEIDKIYISCIKGYIDYMKQLVHRYMLDKVVDIIPGGETGQDSIYLTLKRAAEDNSLDSIVLIHDGVRPLINNEIISKNIQNVKEKGSAITCNNCTETVILSSDSDLVSTIPLRREAFLAQAPQSFYLKDILKAHENIRKNCGNYDDIVDSCTLMSKYGDKKVSLIEGPKNNIKVTTPEDFYKLRALLTYIENLQISGTSSEVEIDPIGRSYTKTI